MSAKKQQPKGKTGPADQVIELIGKLNVIERAQKEASADARYRARQTEALPVLEKLRAFLENHHSIKAITQRLRDAYRGPHMSVREDGVGMQLNNESFVFFGIRKLNMPLWAWARVCALAQADWAMRPRCASERYGAESCGYQR